MIMYSDRSAAAVPERPWDDPARRAGNEQTLPAGLLNAGGFAISPRIALRGIGPILLEDASARFEVMFDHGGGDFFDASRRPGVVAPRLPWALVPEDAGL